MVTKFLLPLTILLAIGLYAVNSQEAPSDPITTNLNIDAIAGAKVLPHGVKAGAAIVAKGGAVITKGGMKVAKGLIFKVLSKVLKRFAFFNPFAIISVIKIFPPIIKKLWRAWKVEGLPIIAIPFEILDIIRDNTFFSSFDPERINFMMYDKQNSKYKAFRMTDVAMTKKKLYFVTHGWLQDTYSGEWMNEMAAALLENDHGSNVVVVDWSEDAFKYLYPLSAHRTKAIGEVVAQKILEIEHRYNFNMNKIVLIGYGLGAHVFGLAGKYIKSYSEHTLPLIVGLDPSGYLFQNFRSSKRLASSDADTVMVVHTSGAVGFTKDCGTIDFYPNGGREQPGCSEYNVLCDHRRSIELFTTAVTQSKHFKTKSCDSESSYKYDYCQDDDVLFGNIEETKPGKYFFDTTASAPFYIESGSGWSLSGIFGKVRKFLPF